MELLEEIKHIKTQKKDLRSFGIILGLFLCLIAFLLMRKHHDNPLILIIGAVSILLGLFSPSLLKYVYKIWMGIALTLGWIMSRIIVTLLFLTLFSLLSVLLKVFKKDLLEQKINRRKTSYWKKRVESKPLESYKKQY